MSDVERGGSGSSAPQNYIFGYGSLIEDASRQSTTPSARNAWPAQVRDIRRGWWARGADSGLTTTFLGALLYPFATCNGVLYAVTELELAATDARETAGYDRREIHRDQITMLDGRSAPPTNAVFWIYLNRFPISQIDQNLPSPQFPMVQSYVDICVNGCLEVEGRYPTAAGFTREFFRTTEKWSKYWVNDRVYPRRPFIFQPNSKNIDDAIKAAPETAQLYYEVEIEPASWEDRKPVRPPRKQAAKAKAKKTAKAAGPRKSRPRSAG